MSLSPQEKLANKLLRQGGSACDCGGPQYGTAHAPDCAFVLAADNAWQEAGDILWDRQSERADR